MFIKSFDISGACICDRFTRRTVCLNNDSAAGKKTPGAACHLCYECKGAFGSPEVGEVKTGVCKYDAYKLQSRKVQTFCNHLCAEQYVIVSASERAQFFFKFAFFSKSIGINPDDTRIWKFCGCFGFDILGAETGITYIE